MANQRIDQLNAETTPAAADVLPVYSIAGSDTKKITVKDLVQQGAALVDDASIPVAKVNLSGISGTNLTNGTVTAAKLDTSTIPATGGVTVSSSNLQLVAPTSPIVRNAGTGSLEHAVSGATAGTYTKVTVDTRGHVTVGALLAGADLPVATSSVVGGVSIPAAGGLALTGGGALSHSNSVAGGASTRSGITYDLQGHIVSTAALVAADLPVATNAVKGAVIAGGGLAIDGSGIVSVNVATTTDVGGIKIGSEFGLNGSNQLLLATQASVAGGTAYPKVTVNSKGIVTAGASLTSADIPALDTTKITSGTLSIDRYGANTITGAKLANYSISKISDAFPTADYISQLYFSPLEKTLYMWDGNVYQPIGVSYGQVVFSGTYDAGTNLIASVTTEGAAIGLTVGGALVSPVTATKGHYVVVDQPGTGTAPAPTISLSPPDMLLSNGTTWVLLDVSDTVTAQLASNIQVSPAGNIASTNVQSALQELDDEKLAKAGGTLTGNLALNTGIAIVYEGATTDDFETTLYVVDPTADRTILLPNVSGTVVTTGDTGTVTSTMLLDGTILNEDINASAAIVDTKLATIATAGKVSNSATTAASANTASAIVARDASGNFTAGTITAALTGAASSNVLKAGDTMTGALVVPLGAVGTPSLTFTGDLNTGIYSPSADALAASTAGVEHLRITSSGRVGIGTSSPTVNLHVVGASGSGGIQIGNSADSQYHYINFGGDTTSDNAWQIGRSPTGGIGPNNGFYIYDLKNNLTRLSIDASGRVGIGVTSPNQLLQINSTSVDARLHITNSVTGSTNSDGFQLQVNYSDVFFHNLENGNLIFQSNSTERARIDTSGRLLVGTSTARDKIYNGPTVGNIPQFQSEVSGDGVISRAMITGNCGTGVSDIGPTLILARSTGTTVNSYTAVTSVANHLGSVSFQGADGTEFVEGARIEALVDGTPGANDMPGRLVFSTTSDSASSPTERMRINSSGNIMLNTTSVIISTTRVLQVNAPSGTAAVFKNDTSTTETVNIWNSATSGNNVFLEFATETSITARGSITYNRGGGVVAYNITSDYRAKTLLGAVENPGETIDALKVYRGVMNGATVERPMLVAHEAQEVAPYCVTGEKDAEDDNGNPIYQQMDHQVLIPLLIAEIQQLRIRVAALEAA
jgi:hypothetical protein